MIRSVFLAIFGGIFVALLSAAPPSAAHQSDDQAAQQAVRESWPIGSGDLPDPHIVRGVERWWVFGTNSGGQLVPTRSSNDLLNWRAERDSLAKTPAWGTGEIWAPAVTNIGGRWVMYFTDKFNDPRSPHRCIGLAISSSPGGPFQPFDLPLACDPKRGGHIDPSLYLDADGTPWLLYKNDDPTRDGLPVIRSRQLRPDGLAFAAAETALVAADAPWEAGVNENPSMVTGPDGRLHLFWSGNDWRTSSYSMGHAVCEGPAGPCVEDDGPWLTGLPGGSAGGSVTPILDGTGDEVSLLTLHRWERAEGYENGGFRSAVLRTVAFDQSTPRVVPATIDRLGPFAQTCRGQLATIVGTAGDDQLRGTRFRDVVSAGAGDDRVSGGVGRDLICGDDGDDALTGGRGSDSLWGGDGDDTLKGENGSDELSGGPGKDLLAGGKGSDNLTGGRGADTLNGGGGEDVCHSGGTDRTRNC